MTAAPEFVGCHACDDYAVRRGQVVFPEIVKAADAQGVDPAVKALEFLNGVHARHLSGRSI